MGTKTVKTTEYERDDYGNVLKKITTTEVVEDIETLKEDPNIRGNYIASDYWGHITPNSGTYTTINIPKAAAEPFDWSKHLAEQIENVLRNLDKKSSR